MILPGSVRSTLDKISFFFKRSISVILLTFYSALCQGKDLSGVSETGDKILYEILNLNLITARKLIDNELKKYPDTVNMYLEYLYNWNRVIEIVLYEDHSKYEKYLESLNDQLEHIDKKANKKSPSYHILLGEIYSHAGMAQVFYRDYFPGFIMIMKANNNSRKNLEKFPGFWMNNKLCGTLNVSLDQLSPFMKTIAAIFNFSGDPETGFRQLSKYLKDVEGYPGLKAEGLLYSGFALRMAKNEEKAYNLFKKEISSEKTPALTNFLYSSIMYFTGRNEEARKVLSGYAGSKFEIPFPFKDYLYGKVLINHLEKEANVYFKRFMENSKSQNYKREVSLKLSDYYLMNSRIDSFKYYRKQIEKFPEATTERDREADVENKRPYNPHPQLLKCRYLIQGGYYTEASEILSKINPDLQTEKGYKTEYYLLMAELMSGQSRMNDALINCESAIREGRDRDEHYAAEAALLAGDILSRKGEKDRAGNYYRLALDIKGQDDVYMESISKRAKNRLRNI